MYLELNFELNFIWLVSGNVSCPFTANTWDIITQVPTELAAKLQSLPLLIHIYIWCIGNSYNLYLCRNTKCPCHTNAKCISHTNAMCIFHTNTKCISTTNAHYIFHPSPCCSLGLYPRKNAAIGRKTNCSDPGTEWVFSINWPLQYPVHCALYTILCIVHCTLYTLHSTVYAILTLNTGYWTLLTKLDTANVNCTLSCTLTSVSLLYKITSNS